MMKSIRLIVILFTVFAVSPFSLTSFAAHAQDPQDQNQATPLMRGYRTGYSDGFQAGVSDLANNAPRDFRAKADYERADRAYNPSHGSLEEYRDGYQQGYEIGYSAAFDHKAFDSTIPADLKRRGAEAPAQAPADQTSTTNTPTNNSPNSPPNS